MKSVMSEHVTSLQDEVSQSAPRQLSLVAPLRVRNFRYLWIGQNISLIGDQF